MIVINHVIRVRVLSIRGDKVRIGVEAPPDVPVHREEIEVVIQAEKKGEVAA